MPDRSSDDSGAETADAVPQKHATWRSGRPSAHRLRSDSGEPSDHEEPGWVEGMLRERLLDGVFDDEKGDSR